MQSASRSLGTSARYTIKSHFVILRAQSDKKRPDSELVTNPVGAVPCFSTVRHLQNHTAKGFVWDFICHAHQGTGQKF
jgi:hypothetical protein